MARMGKLTPERTERFFEALRRGGTISIACMAAGISLSTWQNWKVYAEDEIEKRDEDDPDCPPLSPWAEFYIQARQIEAQQAQRWLQRISDSAEQGTWQAAAWLLERRFTSQYGRSQIEHVGSEGGAIQVRHEVTMVEVVRDPRGVDDDFNRLISEEDAGS